MSISQHPHWTILCEESYPTTHSRCIRSQPITETPAPCGAPNLYRLHANQNSTQFSQILQIPTDYMKGVVHSCTGQISPNHHTSTCRAAKHKAHLIPKARQISPLKKEEEEEAEEEGHPNKSKATIPKHNHGVGRNKILSLRESGHLLDHETSATVSLQLEIRFHSRPIDCPEALPQSLRIQKTPNRSHTKSIEHERGYQITS